MSLNKLAELLNAKSEQINLFSKQDRELLLEKHFPDALEVLDLWEDVKGKAVLDLGTGGGVPGLVLACEAPSTQFVLMDSVAKKIHALQEISEDLSLENVGFEIGRFEELAHEKDLRSHFDVVVARAVSELSVLLEYAAGFLKVGGQLYAWKGPNVQEELVSAQEAMRFLDMELVNEHAYELAGGLQRWLLVFEKTAATLKEYPRKTGLPKKKPL